SQVADNLSEKRLPRRNHVTTFDIKAIDFNEIECNNEIDNLFYDMVPVLKFSHHLTRANKITSSKSLTKVEENGESIRSELGNESVSNLNLFEPKEMNDDELKCSAWNDSLGWDINELDLDNAKPNTPF